MGKGQELLDAAREGDRRTVEKVIGHILTKRSGPFPSLRRIGVNVQDDSGYTSLHHACLNGHREIVQLLLSVSASPCIKNKSGGTPLHLAAFKGYADIVRMLLENTNPPVNIDEVTGNGETALLIAAQFGFKDVVALLESRGADVTIKNRKDESPLDLAAQYGRLEVVRHLIYVRPQLIDPYRLSRMRDSIHLGTNTSPLHLAARSAHNEVIEVLLNAGVDPNIRNDNGSALHEAFARDETIRLLLSRGADLRVRNKRGKTLADVLADFPAEATRKVRAVIREFSHDSEEDLPRFPIDIDQSPTGYVSMIKASSSVSLSSNTNRANMPYQIMTNPNLDDLYENLPAKDVSPSRISNHYSSRESLAPELIERTDSFLNKKNMLEKLLGGSVGADSKMHVKRFKVLNELQNLHTAVIQSDNPPATSKHIADTNVFRKVANMWPDLELDYGYEKSRNSRLDSMEGKKRPQPLPKPVNKYDTLEETDYSNGGKCQLTVTHERYNTAYKLSSTTQVTGYEPYDECIYANTQPENVYANTEEIYKHKRNSVKSDEIYANLPCINVPDDYKATNTSKLQNNYDLPISSIKLPSDSKSARKPGNYMSKAIRMSTDPAQISDDKSQNDYLPMIIQHNSTHISAIKPTNYLSKSKNKFNESTRMSETMSHSKTANNSTVISESNLSNKYMKMEFKKPPNNSSPISKINSENQYMPMFPKAPNQSTPMSKTQEQNQYLPMNKIKGSKQYLAVSNDDNTYMLMDKRSRPPSKSSISPSSKRLSGNTGTPVRRLSLSVDFIESDIDVQLRSLSSDTKTYSRIKSIPDCFRFGLDSKPYSMHIRGVSGCLFKEIDYQYIYVINRETQSGKDSTPFDKLKTVESDMPCYCKDLSNYESLKDSQYLSCETVNDEETLHCSVEDLKNAGKSVTIKGAVASNYVFKKLDGDEPDQQEEKRFNLFRKKAFQIKQLLADWMAPETQKISNKNESLLSPSSSSLTKSHPQSFVKKFASKCLGLKAKFNSAPNISNNAGTESESDVATKSTNQKTNTNTLLIGNSKFFKILSKKEDSGDIVCNDEFDTISLDRLGSLNRDSVVNRSNRSCPGFKTSLPNISENNELSDHESIADSVVITEIDCDKYTNTKCLNEAINYNPSLNIFEPRERTSIISIASTGSAHLINECYESYEFEKSVNYFNINSFPRPVPRPNVLNRYNNGNMIYENVSSLTPKPTPAARTHIPGKLSNTEGRQGLYENVDIIKKPEPPKRTILPSQSSSLDDSRSVSRSSTMSSDSLVDETNLEDILLSQKSKSFRHGQIPSYSSDSYKSDVRRTQSITSDFSDVTEASAIENVDCSDDKALYLTMTGTLPVKKINTQKKKVLFRHKTFTNIEADRNSVKVKDLPKYETLAHYHIRGTGHCIYNAPTVEEFIYIFNRDTLYKNVPPFTKVPNDNRDSYFETAICFCKPRPPKHHNSAEDLIERSLQDHARKIVPQTTEEKVSIDLDALKTRREIFATSFKCFCDSGTCAFHSDRRESLNDFIVKFSAIKKSISTPDITLNPSFSTGPRKSLPKNVLANAEEPYAVVSVEDIIQRVEPNKQNDNEMYMIMSQPSSLSSTASRMYSLKDIAEVISLNQSSTASTLSNASDVHLPVRKSTSSEYSGWSLQSCNSNVTIRSDASFKTCLEESSDENSDGTLHSDDESDTETIKSDISTAKRPWVHSDSFRFGGINKPEIDTIVEEGQSSFEEKFESMSTKFESGISVEGSESSSSGCEDDSGVPRGEMSLGASLERGSVSGAVRSGSGRRRWDDLEGMSEGDALSLSSATSSCAPLHLAHHHDYSKVSPTPPKKPPRRNLSVSPTHANSPSSGYSYELRVHARSQDDLDDIQGAKHYLKHGRSVDHYVDSKLSYSEYEENHNSPRVVPIPNPRSSLKHRSQPVAITAMYENVAIKEQNPKRKLRRNNFDDSYEPKMTGRKYSHQKSSLESLLDDQSMNSPSSCERYYDGPRVGIPLSPTHYEQPPTPEHPPPSARQAENSIHERIRPLSQLIMEVVEEIRIRKKSQGDSVKNS